MSSSMSPSRCPECGALLTPGAAEGLCPRCLMRGAAAPSEPAPLTNAQPPAIVDVAAAFPQFEVVEMIGHGGMGAVFKVRQAKLNRFAALKLLPQSLATDSAFADRFEREAQLLAKLSHPNIVAVYDYGQAGEFFFLLMEHVDGVNLRQAMGARRFTPAQALGIVPKICEALQYAHDEGVLHRDIKPENILLDGKGRVKLVDFGIAKLVADGSEETRHVSSTRAPSTGLTQAGALLGTPSYMAPEQRDTPGDIDHRADIYSLGVVFYELLTGELPIGKFAPPSAISAADPRVDAIVQQALEKERDRRQHCASEVKTQVEAVAADRSQDSPPTKTAGTAVAPNRQGSSVKTHTQIAAVLHIGLGLFALLGAFCVFTFLGMAGGIVISQGEKQAAGVLGIVALCVGGFLAVVGLPGVISGWALYSGRAWAWPIVLVLGFLNLPNIPFGTAVGIYTIWALLSERKAAPTLALSANQPSSV